MKKLLLILLCVPLIFSCGENKKKPKESQACKCERYIEELHQILRGDEDDEELKIALKLEEKVKECEALKEEALNKGKDWECEGRIIIEPDID